jgi:epoxyqueuosine reductase
MAWMAEHRELRSDPRGLLEGARSVIVVADRYADGRPDRVAGGPDDPPRGRIARYARGGDYHRLIKRRLHALADELAAAHPGHRFRACVDTAPILEREVAAAAGLGSIGKHTLLIEPGVGSWLLIGELLTTLPIEATGDPSPSADDRRRGGPDVCGSCTRCIDACPTGCIEPFRVDAARCISYLTIEHRERIDPEQHAAIGDWIFGCDVCQEVCPHGRPTRRSRRQPRHEGYAARRDGFDLLEVLGWTEDDRREAFTTSAMKRAKLPMMKRNALIAAGNRLVAGPRDPRPPGDETLRRRIEAIAGDAGEPDLVRETARDVLARLDRGTRAD